MQELSERSRANKERRAVNKLVREAESRNSPAFDEDTPRNRKNKKGKSKMVEQLYDATPLSNGKRKRGKAMSITPSLNGDDDDDRDVVRSFLEVMGRFSVDSICTETPQDESRRNISCHT